MKKFLLSFMMLFALSLMTNAQVLLQEGFENGVPATWTTIDNDGDGYNWCAMGYGGHSGETCISSASYISGIGGLTPDNWLITPQIDLTGNAILRFYVCSQNAQYSAEHYAVLISTTGNAVSDFTTVLLEETITVPSAANRAQTPYVVKSINLSAYAGQQVYIAFRHYNTSNRYCLNLDDVSITLIPTTPTITTTEVSHNFGIKPLGLTTTWSTTVENYNLTQDVTAIVASPFAVSADGSTYGQTATIPATGGTLYVKFAPTVATTSSDTLILSSAGAPDVFIAVEGTGLDCYQDTFPYFCSFTPQEMLCWQIVDANNDGCTFLISNGGYAYYIGDFLYDRSADEYLISPQIDFNGGVYLTLDYMPYAWSYGSFEKFEVLAIGADTINLTGVIATVEDGVEKTLLVDLDTLVGSYSIAIHCISDAGMDYLFFENFGILEYGSGRVIVDENVDLLDFSVIPLGQDKVFSVEIANLGVADFVTYNAPAPFQVSLDNVNFSSQIVRPVPASNLVYDTLYVKFAPTAAGVFTDFVTVTYLSNVDSIRVIGEGVDCYGGIAEFPFAYNFNRGLYPPICWTVNTETNFSQGTVDDASGDYCIIFRTLDRLVTPEIHSTIPLLLTFDYSSEGGAQAVTSFVVGYSMNTVAEEDFVWYQAEVADSTEFETYSNIIPANAKYVAIKVTEMNQYNYSTYIINPNYLFVDNFVLAEITDPMLTLSSDSLDYGGLVLGQSSVKSVILSAALYPSPFTATSNQADYTVSTDGVTYGSTVTLPAEGGTLYIKYEPTTEGTHSGIVAMTSDATTVEVAVLGRGFDCEAVNTLPYYEGFEEEYILCWDNIDADGDDYFWKFADNAEEAHTGSRYVYSESYDYGALTPDNFFISPMISIPEGGAILGWFVTATDNTFVADHYSVLVYAENQEESYDVVFSETMRYKAWEWREVDLHDYAGSNIRFAFRHHNCTDHYSVAIDDIQVTAGAGIERHEVTVGIYPNPATDMININASENMDQIQVVNMAGQCIYSAQVGGNNTQVNVSNLADGLYFVKVYTDSGNVSTKKIVVRK